MTPLPEKLQRLMDELEELDWNNNPDRHKHRFSRGFNALWNFLLSEGSAELNLEELKAASKKYQDELPNEFGLMMNMRTRWCDLDFLRGATWAHSQTIAREKALELEIERLRGELEFYLDYFDDCPPI